jgi:hypothetical protein
MEDTTETRVPAALSVTLAGLQAGMLGALWMLAWLGVSSAWQNRGFWNPENIFAAFFYGSDAVRDDFGSKTLAGLALYLLIYSLLGCVFALALRGRLSAGRLRLAGIAFALAWFYLSFHLIWKSVMPLAYLLSSDRPMVVAHLIFGLCIGRFPAHYPGPPPAAAILQPAALEPVPADSAEPAPVHDPPAAPGA